MQLLFDFFDRTRDDPRISSSHISMYTSLWRLSKLTGGAPLCVFSAEVKKFCKISSDSTYCKIIRELQEYGYIRYRPSCDPRKGSKVEFVVFSS